MDVHLRRGSLRSGSDAELDGAARLKQRRRRIHGHFEVVNLLAEPSSARPKLFSNSENNGSNSFGCAFQQPARNGQRVLRRRAGFVLSKYAAVTFSRDAAGIICIYNIKMGGLVVLPVTHRDTGAKSCGQDRLTRICISWVGRRV